MKTSAAGEGCPRSAATERRGHGNAAGSNRGKSRDLCTKIIPIDVDPATVARPERLRSANDRRKDQIRTYMQPSITSNPSTKRPKLHPRRSQSPNWGATAPHSQPDIPSACLSPFALFPFLGSTVFFFWFSG